MVVKQNVIHIYFKGDDLGWGAPALDDDLGWGGEASRGACPALGVEVGTHPLGCLRGILAYAVRAKSQ